MTTVIVTQDGAWADSASAHSGMLCPETGFRKLGRWSAGVYVWTGVPVDPKPLILWFEEYLAGDPERWPYPPVDEGDLSFSVLFAFARGKTISEVATPGFVYGSRPIGDFQVHGSGGVPARAALLAGADPLVALRVAAQIDPFTRAPFHFMPFDLEQGSRKYEE